MRAVRINCVVASRFYSRTRTQYCRCARVLYSPCSVSIATAISAVLCLCDGNRCNWERFVQQKGNQYVINLSVYNWNLPTMIFVMMSIFAHNIQPVRKTAATMNTSHGCARMVENTHNTLSIRTPYDKNGTFSAPIHNDLLPLTAVCCWMCFQCVCVRARARDAHKTSFNFQW